MKTFRDIYELPLKPTSHSWVYDNRSNFVFQFEPKFTKDGDYIKGWKNFEKNVIDKLNGNQEIVLNEKFTHVDGKIFYKDIHVMTIRGWGNLTGIGAHNLPEKEAANIQDTFAEWMVETLNKNIGEGEGL